MIPPEHVIPATDHAAQRSLDLLGANLELRFNTKLERYEVWRWELGERGLQREFIVRVEDQGRFAEPGEWLLNVLRARDARYVPAEEAARKVIAEIDAENAKLEAERKARREEQIAEFVDEHARAIGRGLASDYGDIHPTADQPFAVPSNYPEKRDAGAPH